MEVAQRHPSRTAESEHRWPAVAGLLVALALYAFLPNEVLGAQRFVVVGIGLALLVPLVVVNPHRMTRQTPWTRALSVALALVLVTANQVALVVLVTELVGGGQDGPSLLLAALQVWVANVIGFSMLYWELDRGGPVARTTWERTTLPPADLRFPQDEDDGAVAEVAARSSAVHDWTPRFVDYLYSSLSNSMAFSATDAMPLSPRFKLLMGLQAFGGFAILALVIARSVNILA
jgi:branched-subunit amino acid transport protein